MGVGVGMGRALRRPRAPETGQLVCADGTSMAETGVVAGAGVVAVVWGITVSRDRKVGGRWRVYRSVLRVIALEPEDQVRGRQRPMQETGGEGGAEALRRAGGAASQPLPRVTLRLAHGDRRQRPTPFPPWGCDVSTATFHSPWLQSPKSVS